MQHLWGSPKEQRAIVEIVVLADKHCGFNATALPNFRVSGSQEIQIAQVPCIVAARVKPAAQPWRKIDIDEKLHLLSGISR